jgi:hypothetical protein
MFCPSNQKAPSCEGRRGDLLVPLIASWLTIEKFLSKNLEEGKGKQPCASILRTTQNNNATR